jgi:hypothetical protein
MATIENTCLAFGSGGDKSAPSHVASIFMMTKWLHYRVLCSANRDQAAQWSALKQQLLVEAARNTPSPDRREFPCTETALLGFPLCDFVKVARPGNNEL